MRRRTERVVNGGAARAGPHKMPAWSKSPRRWSKGFGEPFAKAYWNGVNQGRIIRC